MARNDLYEDSIHKQGLAYEYYEHIPLGDIDEVASLGNQVRLEEPIHQDLIDQYAESMESHSQFPPIVIHKSLTRKGKYVILDGNHRYRASKKLGRSHIDAYIIHTEDRMVLDRLRGTFNNLVNGLRLTPQETMHHAADYCRRYDVPTTTAAKLFAGVKATTLANFIRIQDSKDKLAAMSVKVTPVVTDSHILHLAPLTKVDDNLFARTVKAIGHTGATIQDTQDLVREIGKAGTIDDKNKVVDEFVNSPRAKEMRAETKGGTVKVRKITLRDQLATALRTVQRLVEDHDHIALTPSPTEFQSNAKIAKSVVEHLTKIFKLK